MTLDIVFYLGVFRSQQPCGSSPKESRVVSEGLQDR